MDTQKTLASLLIPMQQKPLLVPQACVAEVVDYRRPVPSAGSADWHLGNIDWREQEIPLLSFERANHRRFADFSATARIAVINKTSDSSEIPFYALVIQGLPQAIEATEEELVATEEPIGPAEIAQVSLREMPAVIPNLPLVESMLNQTVVPRPPAY